MTWNPSGSPGNALLGVPCGVAIGLPGVWRPWERTWKVTDVRVWRVGKARCGPWITSLPTLSCLTMLGTQERRGRSVSNDVEQHTGLA